MIDTELRKMNLPKIRGRRQYTTADHADTTVPAVQSMTPSELSAMLRQSQDKSVKPKNSSFPQEIRDWIVAEREQNKRTYLDIASEMSTKFPGYHATEFTVRNAYNRRNAPARTSVFTPEQYGFLANMLVADKPQPEIRKAFLDRFGIDISKAAGQRHAKAYDAMHARYRPKKPEKPTFEWGDPAASAEARRFALERLGATENGDIVPVKAIIAEIEKEHGEKWRIDPEKAAEVDAERRKLLPATMPEDARGFVSGMIDELQAHPDANITTRMIANETFLRTGHKVAPEEIERMMVERGYKADPDDMPLAALAARTVEDPVRPEEASQLIQACKAV
jgi:hypothetical protein